MKWRYVLIPLLLAVAGLLIGNNLGRLRGAASALRGMASPPAAPEDALADSLALVDGEASPDALDSSPPPAVGRIPLREAPLDQVKEPQAPAYPHRYRTALVEAPLRDEPLFRTYARVDLYYSAAALGEELGVKSGEVDAVVQRTLAAAGREDLRAPVLRGLILEAVNRLLKSGRVEDVVFRDFRLEIQKK